MFLAKVARVVQHDVEQHLDTSRVGFVNKRLERGVAALVAVVDTGEIARVIAVVIEARGVLDDGRYPHSRESQRLDIV